MDFRDPFAAALSHSVGMPKIRRVGGKWLERKFLENADLLFVTSEEARQLYIKRYPLFADKVHTIYNGFDPVVQPDLNQEKNDKFTIIYTGVFYTYGPNHQLYTDLFFKGLAHLKEAGEITAENFQFRFFGEEYERIKGIAKQHGVGDLVDAQGRIPYEDVLNAIVQSHLMLLRIVKLMISTKLYEGISLNIPFLATIPHGEAEEIIREYSPGSYIVTENESHLDVAEAIKNARDKYRDNQMPANQVERFLSIYTREKLTQKLMRIAENTLLEKR